VRNRSAEDLDPPTIRTVSRPARPASGRCRIPGHRRGERGIDCPPKRRPSRSLGRALPRWDLGSVADRGTLSDTDPASCGHRVCSAFIGGSGRPEVQPSWRRSRYLPCVLPGTSVCRADFDLFGSETRSRPWPWVVAPPRMRRPRPSRRDAPCAHQPRL